MAQLIDKFALVAEIEKYISNYKGILNKIDKSSDDWIESTLMSESKIDMLQHILSFLNTLEVKEVDLEKELDVIIDSLNNDKYEHLSIRQQLSHIARHFYELGLQVNNPVTAADRGFAEEIIINLKRVENDYHIDLTREMEWLRNKTMKGE